MRPLLLLALALPSLAFAPAPFPKAARRDRQTDLQKLQGEWVVVKYEQGEVDRTGRLPQMVFTFRGACQTVAVGAHRTQWAVDLDVGARPREMTTTQVGGAGSLVRGIYRFDGQTLTICEAGLGAARPAAFDSKGAHALYVLRRR